MSCVWFTPAVLLSTYFHGGHIFAFTPNDDGQFPFIVHLVPCHAWDGHGLHVCCHGAHGLHEQHWVWVSRVSKQQTNNGKGG